MLETNLRRELRQPQPCLALFLDFDGTLADLAPVPDAVTVEPWLPEALHRIGEALQGALAIVTGRPVAFIDDRLAPYRFDVAGLHGAELRLAGQCFQEAADEAPLRRTVQWLDAVARGSGLVVEDKGLSVALHWRLAPQLEKLAKSLAREALEQLGPDFRLQEGKSVIEVLPATAAKGNAIRHLVNQPAYAGRAPIFIGDDIGDEHGFDVVRGLGGYSVRVGDEKTSAQYRMASPAVVRRHIRFWADRAGSAA